MESEGLPRRNLLAIAPHFLVDDVVHAAEYYRDKIGFDIGPYFGDPAEFVIVERDGIRIQLSRVERARGGPNRKWKDVALDAYLWVHDVEALYEELRRKEAMIVTPPVVRFYGIKEIEIRDLDGYILCFGEPLSSGAIA